MTQRNGRNLRIGVYARCSTAEQDTGVQLRELRNYAKLRGWTNVQEFTDEGVSGAKERRPALDALMDTARRRKLDVIVVWKFDRFARSTKQLILALDEFRGLGVDFVSVTENIDTSSPLGQALFTIVAAIGAFELELIRERVRAGVAKAKASGKTLGRPRRWTPDMVKKARAMRKAGLSWRATATAVGLPLGTLQGALNACRTGVRKSGSVSAQ